jgi:sugar lactone lactonase YvrE/Tfp pilus assembly protein FimT
MRRGFTLLELGITLTIAVILGIIILPNLFGIGRQSDLNNTALQLRLRLDTARTDAIDQNQASSWGIHFLNPSSGIPSYSVFKGNSYATGTVVGVYTFPSDISYASSTLASGASRDVVFLAPSGGASVSTTLTLIVTSNPAMSSSIAINLTGDISGGPIYGGTGGGSSTSTSSGSSSSQYLYVVDTGNNRIQKLSLTGVFQSQFPCVSSFCPYSGVSGQFGDPNGIAINSNGNIYVIDINNYRVEEFNASDTYITQLGCPSGSCSPGGSGNNQFAQPNAIAIDPRDNSVYVADTGNNRVVKFNSAGTYQYQIWCPSGSGACSLGGRTRDDVTGEFLDPGGLAVDSAGHLWVSDTNNRIEEWSSSGAYMNNEIGTEGSLDDDTCSVGLAGPTDMVIDSSNSIYVVNSRSDCVMKWNPTTKTVLKTYPCSSGTCSLSVDANNNLYVVDPTFNTIQVYSPTGASITSFGGTGITGGRFNGPTGMTIY